MADDDDHMVPEQFKRTQVQQIKVELESRKDGKMLPLSVDKIPQNELQRAIQKLASQHNFEKVAKIKPSEVTE